MWWLKIPLFRRAHRFRAAWGGLLRHRPALPRGIEGDRFGHSGEGGDDSGSAPRRHAHFGNCATAWARPQDVVSRYIDRGLEPPACGLREWRATKVKPLERYIGERLAASPELTAIRLLREVRALGDRGRGGGLRPETSGSEVCLGRQAQVDFAAEILT